MIHAPNIYWSMMPHDLDSKAKGCSRRPCRIRIQSGTYLTDQTFVFAKYETILEIGNTILRMKTKSETNQDLRGPTPCVIYIQIQIGDSKNA